MIIAGCDNGFSGAIALIQDDLRILGLYDMPVLQSGKTKEVDVSTLQTILKSQKIAHLFIEKAQSMPGNGGRAMFNYGMSYATVRTLAYCLNISSTIVPPQTWKKELLFGMPKDKESSIIRAVQLFPEWKPKRKLDHNKSEALLLAYYGIMRMRSEVL